MLLELAAERLDARVGDLTTAKGVVSVGGDASRSVTYADLVGDSSIRSNVRAVRLQRRHRAAAQERRPRRPEVARRLRHRGHSCAAARHRRENRRHLPIRSPRPSARHVARPCGLAARARRARHQQSHRREHRRVVDRGIPGVQIVRRNNFVGVVAEREWDAVRAASQLKVTWQPFAAALPGHEGLFDSFKSAKTNDLDRHGCRRRRRRARARGPRRLGHVSRARTNRTARWRRTARSPT